MDRDIGPVEAWIGKCLGIDPTELSESQKSRPRENMLLLVFNHPTGEIAITDWSIMRTRSDRHKDDCLMGKGIDMPSFLAFQAGYLGDREEYLDKAIRMKATETERAEYFLGQTLSEKLGA